MSPGGALSGASASPRGAVSISAFALAMAATTGGIPQGRGINDGKIRRVDSRRTVRTGRTPHFGYCGAYAPRYNQLSASASGTNADCPRVKRNSRDARIRCIAGAIRSHTSAREMQLAVGACGQTPAHGCSLRLSPLPADGSVRTPAVGIAHHSPAATEASDVQVAVEHVLWEECGVNRLRRDCQGLIMAPLRVAALALALRVNGAAEVTGARGGKGTRNGHPADPANDVSARHPTARFLQTAVRRGRHGPLLCCLTRVAVDRCTQHGLGQPVVLSTWAHW